MTRSIFVLLTAVIATAIIFPAHAQSPVVKKAGASANENPGANDFDFEFGTWRVHHRMKRPSGEWIEFEGTSSDRGLNDGSANVEENTFFRPTGNTQGIALRAFDKKTGLWAIWWVDSRDPHAPLDPPVKGRFVNGVGTFESDSIVNGKPQRTRFIWSHITRTSARWEQAFSDDNGKTWDTNWVMEFKREKT
jgi:hypothetical protein